MEKRLKEKLENEFIKLMHDFPLKKLKTTLITEDSKKYMLTQNDVFICDKIDEENEEIIIVIHYNKSNPLSQTDNIMINKYKLKTEHLPFWYLYHEYGHLLELDEILNKKGYKKAKEWLLSQSEEIKVIEKEKNKDEKYKETLSEKNADLFANNIYMNKVKELILFFNN